MDGSKIRTIRHALGASHEYKPPLVTRNLPFLSLTSQSRCGTQLCPAQISSHSTTARNLLAHLHIPLQHNQPLRTNATLFLSSVSFHSEAILGYIAFNDQEGSGPTPQSSGASSSLLSYSFNDWEFQMVILSMRHKS